MIPMFLRIRPQMEPINDPWFEVVNNTTVVQGQEQHTFKHIFPESSGQSEVYDQCLEPLVHKMLNGEDQTFFALGATGSGKTWTTTGTVGDPGVVYRAVEDIIRLSKGRMVTISMVEIYNDRIYDLLNCRNPVSMRVVSNRCELNRKECVVKSFDEARDILESGYSSRAVNATQCNSQSSRSHAIVFIECGGVRLTLGDLAGNERVNDAGSTGVQLQEAGEINKSLMLFGQALQSLQQGRIVTQGNKLSSLLLVNASRAMPVMLITIDVYNNEKPGRQVLRYATTARKVKKTPAPGRTVDTGANMQSFELRLREELYRETDTRLARLAEAIWA